MKLTKITLYTLTTLIFSTIVNASDDKCIKAYGDVYGDKDSYGQTYEDFLKEQRNQKTSLDFLINNCQGSKYQADRESLSSVFKYLEKTTKISKLDWEKEFKYP